MLPCQHDEAPHGEAVCDHLRADAPAWVQVKRWYTGVGLTAELICEGCAAEREAGASTVSTGRLCRACFEHLVEDVVDVVGVGGRPGLLERAEPMVMDLDSTPLPRTLGRVVDLAPLETGRGSHWLVLTEEAIHRFDADAAELERLAVVEAMPEPGHQPWCGHVLTPRLHVSRDGRSAAVVNDYGRQGQVIDLRHGRVTMQLDGGDYHPDTVPFSAAFVDVGGRSLLAHRTSWNRLDLSDPRDGALLTARGPTSYRRGEERPEHYLDYFHGALRVSPSHRRIADDGWVWHPIGVVTTWELEPWLADPWESEDGASRGSLCARDYYWDHALCWIDDDVIAVGGIGEDDAWIIDGARIFDASTGRERLAFAGPGGTFFSDGASLYASDEGGLSRWDPRDGHRTGHVPGFRPTHHHRAAGELVSLQGSAGRWTLVRWRGLAQPVVASRR